MPHRAFNYVESDLRDGETLREWRVRVHGPARVTVWKRLRRKVTGR